MLSPLRQQHVLIGFISLLIASGTCYGTIPTEKTTRANTPIAQQWPTPALIGLKIHPQHPLRIDFILNTAHDSVTTPPLRDTHRLIRYFLASLTTPPEDMWVNLSPYEKDRLAPAYFGQTEMGRDLLAQDYALKQRTASLLHPDSSIGQQFWKTLHNRTGQYERDTDISMDTLSKVWIVPDTAVVYENNLAATAYIAQARLKVRVAHHAPPANGSALRKAPDNVALITQQTLEEILLPALEEDVNTDAVFAPLRQIYQSLILAAWYKNKLQASPLADTYINRYKLSGIAIPDPEEPRTIWTNYLRLFTRGSTNNIREEADPLTGNIVARKYFSGGFLLNVDNAMTITHQRPRIPANLLTVETLFNTVLDTPAFTPVEQQLLAGSRRDEYHWLGLTDHIQARFTPRFLLWGRFLKPSISNTKAGRLYTYTLPRDISIRETLLWIRDIRKLPLSDGISSFFPELSLTFSQTAAYLDNSTHTDELNTVIAVFYKLAGLFDPDRTLSAIHDDTDSPVKADAPDKKELLAKAVELAIQGIQIEVENLTYWRGMHFLQEKIHAINMNHWQARIRHYHTTKNPTAAAAAEIRAIQAILRHMKTIAGTQQQINRFILESSPAIIAQNNYMNCVGRSALTGLYLQDLGIESWNGLIDNHIFVIARLATGEYFMVEPSENLPASHLLKGMPATIKPGDTLDLSLEAGSISLKAFEKYGLSDLLPLLVNRGYINPTGQIQPAFHAATPEMFVAALGTIPVERKAEIFALIRKTSRQYRRVHVLGRNNGALLAFYQNLGTYLRRCGRTSEAILLLQKALRINPAIDTLWISLGNAQYSALDYTGAMNSYQQSVRLNPASADAHHNWGTALYMMKDYPAAITRYQQALTINPEHDIAHYSWGLALIEMHQPAEAAQHFTRALTINPHNTAAKEQLNRLTARPSDAAMTAPGGIALNDNALALQTRLNHPTIQFHISPELARNLRKASGLTVSILRVQTLQDLNLFLDTPASE
jgi:tetratricopeptide (TPR) repeat protein